MADRSARRAGDPRQVAPGSRGFWYRFPVRPGVLLLVLASTCAAPRAEAGDEAAPKVERFTLPNGLRVMVRPLEGATRVAVTVLFDFGENAEPAGRSGLAHLCEHLWCTAAAGDAPARTADDLARTHPDGWNAQTGWDATVFSGVVPPEGLEAELADASRRLTALRPAESDLQRERARVLEELDNMYARSAALASMNAARQRVAGREAGRHGGLVEDLVDVPLDEAAAFLRSRYRPSAARLVVAGAVDAAAAVPRIRALFASPAAGGPDPPPLAKRRDPAAATGAAAAARVLRTGEDAFPEGARAAAALRAPRPGTEGYAEFLVLAVRLWSRSNPGPKPDPGRPVAAFAPLDDPDFLFVRAAAGATEAPDAVAKRLEAFLREAVDRPLGEGEVASAKVHLGQFLGTMDLPDLLLARNPYLASFALGRREQLGIDGPALAKALDAVTEESLAPVRKKWFGAPAVVVAVPDRR
jgi:zinc protease